MRRNALKPAEGWLRPGVSRTCRVCLDGMKDLPQGLTLSPCPWSQHQLRHSLNIAQAGLKFSMYGSVILSFLVLLPPLIKCWD